MSRTESKRDKLHCYMAWAIFIFFSACMLVMSIVSEWKPIVKFYVPLVVAIMSWVTWSRNVSPKVQSYVFVILSMLNIFGYSLSDDNFYGSIVVICCLAAFCAVFMNAKLMLLLFFLTLAQLCAHIFVFHTIVFTTPQSVIACAVRVLAMLMAELFLVYFVNRQYWIEESLKASVEEARKADRSKADFLANMSHEIRTPMNAIVGMCELILREDITEDVRENCINIQHSGRSLLGIINDILDFSKLDSGKTELVEETFNIGSIVNDVMNMAITRKGDKPLELIARVDPEIPKGLVGDEVRIRQVMINLMTNAIKFTNEGCVILRVTQNRHDYGINLNVSIEDTGIGISPENLEKLFTSFQQVDTRKNRSVEGTGLGLAICKRLIAQMGGFVNVSSVYGEGSAFRFVIPLRVSDPEPFISLNAAENRAVAILVDVKKFKYLKIAQEYMRLVRGLSESFQTKIRLFETINELKAVLEQEHYSHCFVGKEEYLLYEEELEDIADRLNLFVIQERGNAITLPARVKCIYKPFYAMSIAAALNNERYVFQLDEHKVVTRFVAPGASVLIVDDNLTNLKVAEGLMRPYNMKISTAISGKEALELLATPEYDIVFMDHMMPEMDGVEATALIREMEGEYYKKLPIIALTANAVNGAREMFLASGFNDFIAKPIELSFLDRTLRAWLHPEKIQSLSSIEKIEEQRGAEALDSFREVIQEEKGLLYAGESREVYLENLYTYFKNGAGYSASLQMRFAEKDWERYVIEAHAMKSSSLSVGAVGLSELAKELEFAGKEERYEVITAKHKELIRLYERVLREIDEYLRGNGYGREKETEIELQTASVTELSEARLDEYVEQLCNACDNFDADGISLIAQLLASYSFRGEYLKHYFAPVKQLAEDFEYSQAHETARKALETLKGVEK